MIISIIIANLTSILQRGQGRSWCHQDVCTSLATAVPLYSLPTEWVIGWHSCPQDIFHLAMTTIFPSKCHEIFLPCNQQGRWGTVVNSESLRVHSGMRSLVVAEGRRSSSWSYSVQHLWNSAEGDSTKFPPPNLEAGWMKKRLQTKVSKSLGIDCSEMTLNNWYEADLFSNNVIAVERKVSMRLFWLGWVFFYIPYKNIMKKIYKRKNERERTVCSGKEMYHHLQIQRLIFVILMFMIEVKVTVLICWGRPQEKKSLPY